jgi:hypothetical protein
VPKGSDDREWREAHFEELINVDEDGATLESHAFLISGERESAAVNGSAGGEEKSPARC